MNNTTGQTPGITNTTSGAEDLASRLRTACTSVRSKSYPLADLIPLMQQAADALASAPAQPVAEPANSTAPLDERDAFEAWFVVKLLPMGHEHPFMQRNSRGEYNRGDTAARWEAWQARASHGQAPADLSPTAGMNIAQRILHVGGRNNDAGYVEFGSIQAVEALVRQVLRDLPAPATADSVLEDAAQRKSHAD